MMSLHRFIVYTLLVFIAIGLIISIRENRRMVLMLERVEWRRLEIRTQLEKIEKRCKKFNKQKGIEKGMKI